MPSTKRKSGYDTSDPFVASDTNSPPPPASKSNSIRPTKRAKPTSATPSTSKAVQKQIDSEGNPYWALSTNRRVTVSDFKGKTMVSVREYYEKDSTWLPGKKGITMTLEQYAELVKVLPQIERALGKEEREVVGRPRYDGAERAGEDSEVEEDGVKDEDDEDEDAEVVDRRTNGRKANIDATSDEDED